MKWLISLAVGILAILALCGSADPAVFYPVDVPTLTAVAERAGCRNVDVSSRPYFGGVNGYFTVSPDGRPMIVMLNTWMAPDPYVFAIFAHEVGHCQQYMSGTLERKFPDIELDADRRGTLIMCREGYDGPRLVRGLFAWLKHVYEYDGDVWHGSAEARVAQAEAQKMACNPIQGL